MKTLFIAINAQYFHTGLAARALAAYMHKNGMPATVAEYTINQREEWLLQQLYAQQADVYLFSCYIWNVDIICKAAKELRKLRPHALIIVGGPQVSYHSGEFLKQNLAFDGVLVGEGESSCFALLKLAESAYKAGDVRGFAACDCVGLVWRKGSETVQNPAPNPIGLDELAFPYEEEMPDGRILYYESMRGCPFKCSYCLSSAEAAPRFKSLPIVFEELARFIKVKPRQVKFVDRTFNCNKQRALQIWRFLQENDNGETNFHFEISGELLDEETTSFLAKVRAGLFQFEIGVQSTSLKTLQEIQRFTGLEKMFEQVKKLRKAGNIHLHLDLIAGLPFEDEKSFVKSFNTVYAQRPHQLQLGFLKVLAGSGMEEKAESYGLVWQSKAPFEVLYTKWLSYAQFVRLKQVETMLEMYYNSGRFASLVKHICGQFETPFECYRALADFYMESGFETAPISKAGQYALLGAFMLASGIEQTEKTMWLCRFDIICHEKPRAVPQWVSVDGARPNRARVLEFYSNKNNIQEYLPHYIELEPKQLLKMAHIEVFPFNPKTGEVGECAMLFDYAHRDIIGSAKQWQIMLPTNDEAHIALR